MQNRVGLRKKAPFGLATFIFSPSGSPFRFPFWFPLDHLAPMQVRRVDDPHLSSTTGRVQADCQVQAGLDVVTPRNFGPLESTFNADLDT